MSARTEGKWSSLAWGDNFKVESVDRTPGLPIVKEIALCGGPNREANARLLAASPDLLRAAEAARNCIVELGPSQSRAELLELLTLAIEKATGAQA